MLKNLSATQDEAEKQKNTKAEKQSEPDLEGALQLKHYSTYMPADLYAQLQVFVAKQKRAAVKGGEKVSIANVIAESVRQYLEKHDR
ncbi:hypothetical protein ACFOPQ_06645 [Deinococcus antarcticus]|uniref:Uncharacterized protein n=1 Tax=Deinococcus antarcticus TaxID=1298767 RepID=A0ABV8A7I1_9DEIO